MEDTLAGPIPPELATDAEPLSEAALAAITDIADPGASPSELIETIERWRIVDDGAAEWAARHLAAAETEQVAVEAQARAWRARIDEWRSQAVAPLARRAEFFRLHLEDYALRMRNASGDQIKSVRLPSATVTTRSLGGRPVVAKPDEFIAWAEENAPGLLRVRKEPAMAEVGKLRVVERLVARDVRLHLSCGHELSMRYSAGTEAPPAGSPWRCYEDGVGHAVADVRVEGVEVVGAIAEEVVASPAGEIVPGLDVEPRRVSASVRLT